ncbi:exosome complex component RRP40-like [Babylonia areolata]|uniref:exosome complex component RRP40-like n=1 Tax=Babylonia areolata TaxID=304850 RepID=UPI003FCF459C
MAAHVGRIVLPGEKIQDLTESEKSKKIILGPGLRTEGEDVFVCKSGVLKFRDPNIYWIESHQKRYVPVKGEHVIGIVTQKAGDIFRVDIGGSEQASLSYLSFEGATKRNRPDCKVGDMLYCRLLVANKDMEPEVVCIDGYGRSSGMGVVRSGGFLFKTSLNLVRKLISTECCLMKKLGNKFPFEVVVGMNGRVWVKGRTNKETLALVNAICSSENMTNEEIKAMCSQLSDDLAGAE